MTGSPVKIKGILRINLDVGECTKQLTFRAVEDIGHEIVLAMDFGLELDIYVQLKARRWKCGEKGEWYEFIQSKEDSSTAILAECAGLSELNLSQSEIIHEMVKWLISKPSEYLPTTHLTEHHLELTDYIPIRYHHRCRSPAMWKIASETVQEMHRAAVIKTSASD